jgi:uridine kinase
MLGDVIQIKPEYFATSLRIAEIWSEQRNDKQRSVIGIAGESGSGKSVTAVCLQKTLHDKGIKALILHMDDYFHLPPTSNHQKRLESLENVGKHEVNLSLLEENILSFKNGVEAMTVPVVNYKLNSILSEIIPSQGYDVLIIEGTYTFFIENLDFKIYMDRTFEQTREQRASRAREEMSDFIEQVLALEHNIIRPTKVQANVIVDVHYQVLLNN